MKVWALAEVRDGKVKKASLEALGKAADLAGADGEAAAVLIGPPALESLAPELAAHGAKRVYAALDEKLSAYSTDGYAAAAAAAVQAHKPDAILAGATAFGKDLAARLAAKLRAGLATDCLDVWAEGGKLAARRPVYAGKVSAKVMFNSVPQLATLRPNAFQARAADAAAKAEVVRVPVALSEKNLAAKVAAFESGEAGRVELTEATVIVSGGRGVKEAKNFALVEELAKALGAAVGASRGAVDAGWKPHSYQVGQTGKVVSPQLYIACGISGAIQHLAGMSSSKCIVAVNKDPDAPIFKVADYGIVGDLFQIVPALTEEAKRAKA